ncbi:Guanyl-specific ribonuclease Sa [Amycolatopsis arida]|uniref:Guanyl-specific ribonuclease Sa n=1 Tax=Amycolatopsis arida TaxID=587909 RepID=A0A1I5UVG8_9PSEU|nr:ribonuclease domain-containing protein [Amycolatopsis arida]TDX91049.1 guanyl-specific ribonuclease Sa [Amycolatopsis arida]SFP99245.1 Guanyl-specific ribonuclease Sa [Amycolatopsis arida]
MRNRRRITAALVGLIVLVLGGWLVQEAVTDGGGAGAPAGTSQAPALGAESGQRAVPLSSLPPEARDTWKLIEQDGPFPYPDRDGSVFENREKLLPPKASGYYREYTVPTPGSRDRGPRRLVTGSGGELYYTDDHYASFVLVDPAR